MVLLWKKGDNLKLENYKDKYIISILVLIISALHYFTLEGYWPIHDFYRRLYYLPIILAAFKYRFKGGFLTSLIVALFYTPHLIFYFGEINIQVINQFLELGMFLVIGMITGYLVEKDYRKRKLLEFQIIQLANLENYTHNILDSLHSGVIALDKEYHIPSTNRKALTFFKNPTEILQFFEKVNLLKEIDKIFNGTQDTIEMESIHYKNDQTKINLKIMAYPINNITGKKEGVLILLDDITDIKELRYQIKRSERLAAIGQLASGVAHEVRNPLGIIKTISQTIVHDVKDSDIKEGIDIIIHEVDRANKVIKELLDFAKPYKYQVKKLDLANFLRELLVLTKKYGEQKGVAVNVIGVEEAIVEGDQDKLRQAFINIVLNGIQAMETGGVLNIMLKTIDHQWAVITFEDTGLGIPEEILDKIYDPFFTTKDYGTGLGLSITHRIIEEHEGKMEIESTVGEGTIVKISLPLPKKEEKND